MNFQKYLETVQFYIWEYDPEFVLDEVWEDTVHAYYEDGVDPETAADEIME